MTSKKIELIKALFYENNGIVKTAELKKNNVTSRNIQALVRDGMMTRIKQGYYMWNDKISITSEIEIAAKLIPQGVICLFTAIEYYGLSTVNPAEVDIALPRNINTPVLPKSPCIKIYRMTDKHFWLGITEEVIEGAVIKIYDIEKTVCDCFKYDKEIEKSIALEALRNYISGGNCNVQKLLEYAKIMGKKKVILPYVEALV